MIFPEVFHSISLFSDIFAVSPGVAGAASEHPLEGVESNEVRTRGRLSPIHTKKAAAFYCYGL